MDCTQDNTDLNSSLSDFFAQNDTSIYSSAKVIDQAKVQNEENEVEVDGNFPNKRGCYGVSYYDSSAEIIYCGVVKDWSDINQLKTRTMPLVIITISKPNEEFYEKLKENVFEQNAIFNVMSLHRADFSLEKSKSVLMNLNVRDHPSKKERGEDAKNLFLLSLIDFENVEMISSLGGLLSYLTKFRILNQLEDDMEPISIRSLKLLKHQNYLLVDRNTMKSLHIFANDSRQSVSCSSARKQSLSLMTYLDKTRTKAGKLLLKEWLMFPINDMQRLVNRLDNVAFLAENKTFLENLGMCLINVKDVVSAVNRLNNYVSDVRDWRALYQTLHCFISIRDLIDQIDDDLNLEIYKKLKSAFKPDLWELYRLISFVIDFPNSAGGKIRVKNNVSEELDSLKRYYLSLDDYLTQIADEDISNGTMPDFIESMNITYLPQLGFLIMVPIEQNKNVPEGDLPQLRFQFSNESFRFYKNERTEKLDRECGDIDGIITDIEMSIVQKLLKNVIACSDAIIVISKYVAVLDVFASFAKTALDNELMRPEIVKENVLIFKNGRHPLHELCVENKFIPNSCVIGKGQKSLVNIITGPNNSGKSVYIKQCGMIAYMAQIGSFVPAELACVGLADMIFSRIQSQDNNTSTLSTFSSDARQMAYMLRHATPHSILLIDEFGKGTSVEDGVGLVAGIIKYFESEKRAFETPPRTLISTHFHELFNYDLIRKNDVTEFYKMDIMLEQNCGDEIEEKIVYLYRLKLGVSRLSYGISCAKRAGCPQSFIDRAKEISNHLKNQTMIPAIPNKRIAEMKRNCVRVLTALNEFEKGDEMGLTNLIDTIKTI